MPFFFHSLRKIFAPTMDPTSSLRLPHLTNFWQWSEEETVSWWDSWCEQKSYAICEHWGWLIVTAFAHVYVSREKSRVLSRTTMFKRLY